MHLLFIETSTEKGVIAYMHHENILFEQELPFGTSQSKFLMPYLVDRLKPFKIPPTLDAIGVGIGPGSYTGIRLGVSVAQALAYSWKVPLVGVCSLNGFVPLCTNVHFAAILDARIGGLYLRIGKSSPSGISYLSEPQICSLTDVGQFLVEVTHLVTPVARTLQTKLQQYYPDRQWIWQERSPSVQALAQTAKDLYLQGKVITPPQPLELLYLRQTEAEREKKIKN